MNNAAPPARLRQPDQPAQDREALADHAAVKPGGDLLSTAVGILDRAVVAVREVGLVEEFPDGPELGVGNELLEGAIAEEGDGLPYVGRAVGAGEFLGI